MTKVPDISGIEKYSRRKFKSFRLRKKQTTTLADYYEKLSKKTRCHMVSAIVSELIPDNEWFLFKIRLIRNGIDSINRAKNMPLVPPIPEEKVCDGGFTKNENKLIDDMIDYAKEQSGEKK